VSGPYATERDALADALPLPAPTTLHPREARLTALLDACSTAGVEVGGYDRRVLEWLAGWEPATVQVVADLIRRAYRSGTTAT
jgi:hypothetical protein